jgi:peptidyl-prolyl cis-trans isomerase A (cyclophilin A)
MHRLLSLVAAVAATGTCPQPLLDPTRCCTLTSPPSWTAVWTTTSGTFELLINRTAAPLGVDRFYNLVYYGYFQNASMGVPQQENRAGFFRVVPGFVVQYGIAGLPAVSAAWQALNIKDDPVLLSNTAGTIAFATAGPDTRTTQVFINTGDNSRLDKDGFAPFGMVTRGFSVVTGLYAGYGETPDQDLIYQQGDKVRVSANSPSGARGVASNMLLHTHTQHPWLQYLEANFPKLDYTLSVTIRAA